MIDTWSSVGRRIIDQVLAEIVRTKITDCISGYFAVAVSRAGGEAIVAVVSIQPVFKIRIADRGAELLFRFGND
jgi:hypothetical protein